MIGHETNLYNFSGYRNLKLYRQKTLTTLCNRLIVSQTYPSYVVAADLQIMALNGT